MEEQLPQLEAMATAVYAAPSNEERKTAVEALQGFQTSLEFVGHCKLLLEKSSSPYALLFAASSLCEAITANWNTFSQVPQTSIDLRKTSLPLPSKSLTQSLPQATTCWATCGTDS